MAKEIQTLVWCDLCLGEDEAREEATHRDNVITLGTGARAKPLSLDLCERHHKEVYEPLAEALAAYGAPYGDTFQTRPTVKAKSKDDSGPFLCGVPGCTASRPLASLGSLSSHFRKQHGLTIRRYRQEYGDLIQADAPAASTPAKDPELFGPERGDDERNAPIGDSEAVCPECGKVYSHELGNNRPTQALGVHLAKTHGIRSAKVVTGA